jgi:hypothetical protein
MNVTVHIPDDLAARLEAAGADLERLTLDALRRAADELERQPQPAAETADAQARRAGARAAAARIRQARVGATLPEGVTIRDLVNYGRA